MQTWGWTDNAGVERYSIEVVLARFRGELTLLGDARGNGNTIHHFPQVSDYPIVVTKAWSC